MVVDIKHEDNNMIYLVSTEKKKKKRKETSVTLHVEFVGLLPFCYVGSFCPAT